MILVLCAEQLAWLTLLTIHPGGGWLRDIYTAKQTCPIIPGLSLALCVVLAVDNRGYWSTHHRWSLCFFSHWILKKKKKSWAQNWGTWSVKGLPYKHNKLTWNPRIHTKSIHHDGWNLLRRQNSADLWICWLLDKLQARERPCLKQGGCHLRDDTWSCVWYTHTWMCTCISIHIPYTRACVHTYIHKNANHGWYFPGLHTKVISFHSYVLSLQITQA